MAEVLKVRETKAERRSKSEHKLFLTALKIAPVTFALIFLANTICSCLGVPMPILSFIGGNSILSIMFLWLTVHTFRYCIYTKMFVYYILVSAVLTVIKSIFTLPVSALGFIAINLILFGIALLITLILYVKYNKTVALCRDREN